MNELTFRLISLFAAVAYFTVRSVYERRLGLPSKAEQMRAASRRDRIALTIVGVTTVPMWLYMLSPWLDFAAIGLPVPVRLAGLAAALFATVVLALSHRDLGISWSPFGEVTPAGGLVTGGVYRWVRHPMYASFFLFNIGMLALTSNWLSALALLGMLWLYVSRVDHEEGMMLRLFGDRYREYARRTGRIVPGVGKRHLAGKRANFATLGRPAMSGHHARLR